jgi:chromosome segregation ATPase
MIEPIMYLAIGFLLSMLLGLMLLPLVHNRAVRLTTRRLDAATPLSMTEIQADKDQLRAEFAMSARKLETNVEQLKNKTASQAAEIGKKTDAINRMKLELDEKTTTIFTLETRDKLLTDKLQAAESELEQTKSALEISETSLAARKAEIAAMSDDIAGLATLKANHEARVTDLVEQVEDLTDRAETAEKLLAAARTDLIALRETAETATRSYSETRTRNEVLTGRVSELDRQVAAHREDAEAFRKQVSAIEAELSARAALLATRESEIANLRHAQEEARTMITTMRNELSAKAGRALTVERLRNEKAAAEQEMREAQDERAQALRELATVRAQAENAWEVDRMENALLRERIDDIASEVARLALTLEGPNGTIAEILLSDARSPAGATPSLAGRIRALQMPSPPPQA